MEEKLIALLQSGLCNHWQARSQLKVELCLGQKEREAALLQKIPFSDLISLYI
jgi:hypothetical protein